MIEVRAERMGTVAWGPASGELGAERTLITSIYKAFRKGKFQVF
jgi:hypothetical protein